MTIDDMLHLIAGTFIFLSVILGVYVSPYFLLFTGFIGLNLFQSAFTKWCPMMWLLRMAGFKECSTGGQSAVPRT
jgi:hypothetical protein